MSGKDDGIGLFRRMARRVTAPARDLVGLAPRETEVRATEFDKAEMKAMIERKRRNDYVRKRELDTLRRIRREGLSGDQAQALTMQSSRMDESTETPPTQSLAQGSGIKAKIDAIERQMVGANAPVSLAEGARPGRGGPALAAGPAPPVLTTTIFDDEPGGAPTVRVSLDPDEDEQQTIARLDDGPWTIVPSNPQPTFDRPFAVPTARAPEPAAGAVQTARVPVEVPTTRAPNPSSTPSLPPRAPLATLQFTSPPQPPPQPLPTPASIPVRVPIEIAQVRPAMAAAPRVAGAQSTIDLGGGDRVEVSEVVHDEVLDEAVIAFAGGEFQDCERSLQSLVGPQGERRKHEETWLVLFDLYRAIGQQVKFEAMTMDYVERFHRSAPQWFSLPKLLAAATAAPQAEKSMGGGIGWLCPEVLDAAAVARLDALSMQLPSPWVLDWAALKAVNVEGADRLLKLFGDWSGQPIAMQWIAGDKLLSVLHELAPTGARDADPVYWMLRLEALRLAHRPDQFDDAAIDYCVTFEVSPPSWENARCKAQLLGLANNTRTLSLSVVGEAITSFLDSRSFYEDESAPAPVRMTSIELAGQLSGDMGELLARLSEQAGDSRVIRISCALLMRVDFLAAGDLLNWVAERHAEGREIVFVDTHRLVALMFGAMGINESARVLLRQS